MNQGVPLWESRIVSQEFPEIWNNQKQWENGFDINRFERIFLDKYNKHCTKYLYACLFL